MQLDLSNNLRVQFSGKTADFQSVVWSSIPHIRTVAVLDVDILSYAVNVDFAGLTPVGHPMAVQPKGRGPRFKIQRVAGSTPATATMRWNITEEKFVNYKCDFCDKTTVCWNWLADCRGDEIYVCSECLKTLSDMADKMNAPVM